MTSVAKTRSTNRFRGLSLARELFLKARLRQSACSEPWVDDQIVTRIARGPGGDEVELRLHDPTVFPPGGRAHTPMRWCRRCGRYTPAPAVALIERRHHLGGQVISATLVCDDCRIADDCERYRELYEAGLHLRPAGSRSFVGMRALVNRRTRPE